MNASRIADQVAAYRTGGPKGRQVAPKYIRARVASCRLLAQDVRLNDAQRQYWAKLADALEALLPTAIA